MRVIFFGTPPIAAEILHTLLNHPSRAFEVVGVVSRPDKAQGRHRDPVATPVKRAALQYDLPLLQPQRSASPEAIQWLKDLQPDLFLVIAYGEIMRQSVLDIPRWGAYNMHASLLPAYRGAAPIERALLDGVRSTGWSLQRMVLACDAGEILATRTLELSAETTAGELRSQLTELAKPMLVEALEQIADCCGQVILHPQDEALVSWAPKIVAEELQLHWNMPAEKVHNRIRAFSPKPASWSVLNIGDKRIRIKILRSRLLEQHTPLEPGYLLWQGGRCLVGAADGALELIELQPEGKRPMAARDFINGLGRAPPCQQLYFDA